MKKQRVIEGDKDVITQWLISSVSEYMDRGNLGLDTQFKRELSKIKFRGEITPAKVKRHGFKMVHQEGVGRFITKNGVRVTDVFFRENTTPPMKFAGKFQSGGFMYEKGKRLDVDEFIVRP